MSSKKLGRRAKRRLRDEKISASVKTVTTSTISKNDPFSGRDWLHLSDAADAVRSKVSCTIDTDRLLTIYVYGDKTGGRPPKSCENHVMCKSLGSAKCGGGGNYKQNATEDPRISRHIAKTTGTHLCIKGIVELIEKDNLSEVAVFCSKGKHRSVTVSLVLRRIFPRAKIVSSNGQFSTIG